MTVCVWIKWNSQVLDQGSLKISNFDLKMHHKECKILLPQSIPDGTEMDESPTPTRSLCYKFNVDQDTITGNLFNG